LPRLANCRFCNILQDMKREPLEELLGGPLRELRQRAGLTQAQLAEAIGISSAAIGQFERSERRPRLAVALRLLKALCAVT
jgi:transcriptional regulator with XRE-family HTH domain